FNAWRAAANLPPVTENTTWSQGDYNHSLYMVKNDQVTHYETSTLPYYTAAGDTAARNGNIQVSSTTSTADETSIDWWMGAPFHALGMLDPRLTSTGFGSYREVKSGWQVGFSLDVLRGNPFTGGTYPVFFPGNGSRRAVHVDVQRLLQQLHPSAHPRGMDAGRRRRDLNPRCFFVGRQPARRLCARHRQRPVAPHLGRNHLGRMGIHGRRVDL